MRFLCCCVPTLRYKTKTANCYKKSYESHAGSPGRVGLTGHRAKWRIDLRAPQRFDLLLGYTDFKTEASTSLQGQTLHAEEEVHPQRRSQTFTLHENCCALSSKLLRIMDRKYMRMSSAKRII